MLKPMACKCIAKIFRAITWNLNRLLKVHCCTNHKNLLIKLCIYFTWFVSLHSWVCDKLHDTVLGWRMQNCVMYVLGFQLRDSQLSLYFFFAGLFLLCMLVKWLSRFVSPYFSYLKYKFSVGNSRHFYEMRLADNTLLSDVFTVNFIWIQMLQLKDYIRQLL